MAILRLSGAVERTWEKPWSKDDGRSGVIHNARIRVNPFVYTDVTLGRDLEGQLADGDMVDLIVDVYPSNGYLRVQATAPWPHDDSVGKRAA